MMISYGCHESLLSHDELSKDVYISLVVCQAGAGDSWALILLPKMLSGNRTSILERFMSRGLRRMLIGNGLLRIQNTKSRIRFVLEFIAI